MEFSRIISGVMTWGVWGKNLDEKHMIEVMNTCIENGINTFDHADIYGGYTTEASFGNAFLNSSIDREKIKLITKCGIASVDGRNNKIKHYNCSKEYIVWSVENALQNLKTDYLDALLLHRPSPLMQSDEIAEAIQKLKMEGKIKSFGVSNFTPLQTELLNQKVNVEFNQIQFSATNVSPMLDGSLDFMQIHKITPMAWNPLGNVFRENNEQTQRLNKLLSLLELKYNASKEVLLLAWIMQHPAGILPVIGTTNIERIKDAVKATSLQLDLEDWFAIWTESAGQKVP